MIEWQHQEDWLGLGPERLLPSVDLLLSFQAMVLEQPRETLTSSAGVACEHDLVTTLAQLADMLCYSFIDIRLLRSLGCEIARTLNPEINDAIGLRLGEW